MTRETRLSWPGRDADADTGDVFGVLKLWIVERKQKRRLIQVCIASLLDNRQVCNDECLILRYAFVCSLEMPNTGPPAEQNVVIRGRHVDVTRGVCVSGTAQAR